MSTQSISAESIRDSHKRSGDNYADFILKKSQLGTRSGFAPLWMPDFLFDFQQDLTAWATEHGKAAIFADCGLGKTPMQLVWAQNVVMKTNGRVLILTPLAVSIQTHFEGKKFGIDCERSRDGSLPNSQIVISNYEQLHKFSPEDFQGVVCDESSILKHFAGATQKAVTRFMSHVPYRLLCTATAAPNDYIELGTSSEALGDLGYTDMLTRFFKQGDHARYRQDEVRLDMAAKQERFSGDEQGQYYAKLAFRVAQQFGQWKLKAHAEVPFWRWVSSWARACRKPSDLGFNDGKFILPDLNEQYHVVKSTRPPDGMLFTLPAFGIAEERNERRRTLRERCKYAAELVNHGEQAIVWCHFNSEGDLLEKIIPDSVQVAGKDTDQDKEERISAFLRGDARVLVSKAKIAGFGLNMQQCHHVVSFVTHSYEAYYQQIRRCWRFGQIHPVDSHIIATEGEERIGANMARKAKAADAMFERLIEHMRSAERVDIQRDFNKERIPAWLSRIN